MNRYKGNTTYTFEGREEGRIEVTELDELTGRSRVTVYGVAGDLNWCIYATDGVEHGYSNVQASAWMSDQLDEFHRDGR